MYSLNKLIYYLVSNNSASVYTKWKGPEVQMGKEFLKMNINQ